MANQPLLALNNKTKMPALGLGVLDRETREQTTGAVEAALSVGYRLVDTAASYLNERHVGKGIARSGVARAIGVSNFSAANLKFLMARTEIVPAVSSGPDLWSVRPSCPMAATVPADNDRRNNATRLHS